MKINKKTILMFCFLNVFLATTPAYAILGLFKSDLEKVQESVLPYSEELTLQEALENNHFFSNPLWESVEQNNNTHIIFTADLDIKAIYEEATGLNSSVDLPAKIMAKFYLNDGLGSLIDLSYNFELGEIFSPKPVNWDSELKAIYKNTISDSSASQIKYFFHESIYDAITKKDLEKLQLLLEHNFESNINTEGYTPLFLATHQAHVEERMDVLELLLKYGADPNFMATKNSPLYEAVSSKNHEIVQLLLKYNADPTVKVKGYSSIGRAIGSGDAELVQMMLESGVNPNELNETTPLLESALMSKYIEIAKVLLEHGADPNIATSNGSSILSYVISQNDFDAVELLLNFDSDPNITFGVSPLKQAEIKNNDPMFVLLLSHGADAMSGDFLEEAVSTNNFTRVKSILEFSEPTELVKKSPRCLRPAIENYNPEILELLLNASKESVSSSDLSDLLPLAVSTNTAKTVRLLIEHGAIVGAGGDLLGIAIKNVNPSIVQILLEAGANPNLMYEKMPLLSYAIKNKDVYIVNLLLDHGADPNPTDKGSEPSPLYLAIDKYTFFPELEQITFLLLEKGANPNVLENNQSYLYQAISKIMTSDKYIELAELLLQHGADPNVMFDNTSYINIVINSNSNKMKQILKMLFDSGANPDLNYPLFNAISRKNEDLVLFLLQNNADPNIEKPWHGNDTISPLRAAMEKDNINIIKILLENGAKPNFVIEEPHPMASSDDKEIYQLLIDHGANISK